MKNEEKPNPVVENSFQFAQKIIRFTSDSSRFPSVDLQRQLFRSGTSIGANVRESQGAESRADFIHKLKIAYKEAEETEYWLLLCSKSENYPQPDDLLTEIVSLKRLIGKIISSCRKNQRW